MVLIQSCGLEDPTVLSGEVVGLRTDSEISSVTLLVGVYEKTPFPTIPSIIREDTIETDSQGKFRVVVPHNEQYSRFTINVLKKVANDTNVFFNEGDGLFSIGLQFVQGWKHL
ncbi:hypothetical protein D0X99_17480 [Algoriphagus lacus]|uniref:Uncharacterized protein n=1 Tax=Algoriphagus lacus TaxID=2056311 RepID=A0A418PMM1_9BACT|nr:hypothetical protein [Algoriphagus lacus]RIW12891.1 hypothetical protein D0X99_17480 [Algoriphagus lacus]